MSEHWTQPEPTYYRKLQKIEIRGSSGRVKIIQACNVLVEPAYFVTVSVAGIPELIEALREVLEGAPEQ